jgi:hypothetical protein
MEIKFLPLVSLRNLKEDIKDEIYRKLKIRDEYLSSSISKLRICKEFERFTFSGYLSFYSYSKLLCISNSEITFIFRNRKRLDFVYSVEFDDKLNIIKYKKVDMKDHSSIKKRDIQFLHHLFYTIPPIPIIQADDYTFSKIKKIKPFLKEIIDFNYFSLSKAIENTNLIDVLNTINLIRRFRHSQLSRLNKDEFSLLIKAIHLSHF